MQGAVPPLHIRLYGVHKGFSLLVRAYIMLIHGNDLSSSRRGLVRLSPHGKGASCCINRYVSYLRATKELPLCYMELLSVIQNCCENSDSHGVTSLNTAVFKDNDAVRSRIPDDGDNKQLCNTCTLLPRYKVLHPRRQTFLGRWSANSLSAKPHTA